MKTPKANRRRFVTERFEQAMQLAGFRNDFALTKKMGVGRSTVSRWKTGLNTPEGETLDVLCRELGVSSGYLFGDESVSDDDRERLAALLRNNVGEPEALIVEALGTVSAESRDYLVTNFLSNIQNEKKRMEREPAPELPGRSPERRGLPSEALQERVARAARGRPPAGPRAPQKPNEKHTAKHHADQD